MLLGHGREQRCDQARRARRRRQGDCRGDRVALVRHGRETAAPPHRGSKASATSVCIRSEIAADLAERADQEAEQGGELDQAVALGVPGQVGQAS